MTGSAKKAANGETLAIVRAAYDGTKTATEIAKELGLNKGYVRSAIGRLKLPQIIKDPSRSRVGMVRTCKPASLRLSASPAAISRYLARSK